MSCGQPSQEEDQSENIPILPPPSTTCVRCGQPPKIVVRATAWCHDCFLASFQGRFRKSLEGAKVVSKNGFEAYEGLDSQSKKTQKKQELSNVVLAFSGGSSSRAMLELFKTSYYKQPEPEPEQDSALGDIQTVDQTGQGDEATEIKKPKKKGPKKQFFPPAFSECQVVFVDESELPGYGPDKTEEVRQIVEETTPFRFVPLKLSTIFDRASELQPLSVSTSTSVLPSRPSLSTASSSSVEKLLALLHPTPPLPPTTFATLHQTLVQSLLLSTARATRGCDVLLLGDNSTRLGVKTISAMSQGRGWSLGEEVSIEYVHQQVAGQSRLLVCRPMGASLAKEVGYYVKNEALETVLVTNEDTSVNALDGEGGTVKVEKDIKKIGIGKLVEDFVLNLEAQFPSTVSIITKTAHKLGMRSADAAAFEGRNGVHSCALCEMPAQVNAEGWNRAITISDLISAREALAQPALPTSLEASAPSSNLSSTGVKRREPYQPSKNHLLPPEPNMPDPATDTHSSTSSSTLPPSSSSSEIPATTTEDSSIPLAGHLCYACLLLIQTSRPSNSKKAPTSTRSDTLDLPPYIAANVEHQRRKETREIRGDTDLKKEIEGYLL